MASELYTSHGRIHVAGVWEQVYPFVFGAIASILWILFGHKLVAFSKTNDWHLDQLYTAVFGFLAVTTGFLATFYCTILAVSGGFIQRIRNTRIFHKFLNFTKQAIVLGFFVSLVTIPMMVTTPLPIQQYSVQTIVVALWVGAATWAISSFARVASSLFFLLETPVEGDRPAH